MGAMLLGVASTHMITVGSQAESPRDLGRFKAIVDRNPFGAVVVPVDPGPPVQAWTSDLVVTAVVADIVPGQLAAIIESKSSKLVYYSVVGETVLNDIVIDRIEPAGDKIIVHMRRGTQAARLDFEPKTAGAAAVAPVTPGRPGVPSPSATPGAPSSPSPSPVPIRRPPIPITR